VRVLSWDDIKSEEPSTEGAAKRKRLEEPTLTTTVPRFVPASSLPIGADDDSREKPTTRTATPSNVWFDMAAKV
jgi:hypothetical protein